MVVSIIMLVSGYNNIIVLPNCTLLYYVFSGPLSLCAYVPDIKCNNNNNNTTHFEVTSQLGLPVLFLLQLR